MSQTDGRCGECGTARTYEVVDFVQEAHVLAFRVEGLEELVKTRIAPEDQFLPEARGW